MRALGTFLVFANPRYHSPSMFMIEDATTASLDTADPYSLMNRLRVMTDAGPKEQAPVIVKRDLIPVFSAVISAMGLPEADIANSMRLAAQDPQRLYAVLKTLDKKGVFRDSPVQEKYVSQFLAAAERWAPDHFGIGARAKQTFRPGP
jgi:hypothetical protein